MYRGVPLKKVLKRACGGVMPDCKHLEFIGAVTYFKYLPSSPRICIICTLRALNILDLAATPSCMPGGRFFGGPSSVGSGAKVTVGEGCV